MQEDLKRCPDCAEMVRAQARVCRFCGYRFDGSRHVAGAAGAAGALADLLRRPRAAVPLPELLAGWGSELHQGESVGYFGYCSLDARYGYLLVTSERVAFFAARGADRVIEWRLEQLGAVEPLGGWRGRSLRVTGPDGTATLRHFESKRAVAEIAQRLGGAAAGG